MIRRATPLDVPFILSVCLVAYRSVPFDVQATTRWLYDAVRRDDTIFLVSSHGFCCAHLTRPFYLQRPHLTMAFLAVSRSNGIASEGYRLLKTMVDCARAVGADFFFSSEIGTDLTPLAKRLGASVSVTPTFRVECWDAGHQQRRVG